MTQPTIASLTRAESAQESAANPSIIGMADQGNMPEIPGALPILPLRATVVFPGTVIPLTFRRPGALKLLEESLPQSKIIGLVAQRNQETESPEPGDLFEVGVAALVLKLLRQPNDTIVIVIQALQRIRLRRVLVTHPFIRAEIEGLISIRPSQTDKEF